MNFISELFSWPLKFFYDLTGNYGVAIILFALLVKLIMLPFQMKSKKSMIRTTSLTPRLKELEKKYEGNKQKYQEEVARIYKEEKVNPMSGCIWSLIPFPILIALYSVIRQPLTYTMGLTSEVITAVKSALESIGFADAIAGFTANYEQIGIADLIYQNASNPAISELMAGVDPVGLNYRFLGLNLGSTPQWNFFMNTDWSDVSVWLPALGLFLIPLISGGLSFLQMKISNKNTAADESANQMKGMMYMMPLISVWIAFVMPGALGIYWIAQNIIGIIQDIFMNRYYGKKLAAEEAERTERFRLREEELERKRLETERLRAEGKTQQNPNTSKRKRQSIEKAREEERVAAEKEAKRLAEGYVQPESQVGKRRYARGRAYVEDRFINPESAEAATAAAAAESEFGESIDEDAVDTVVTNFEERNEVGGSEPGGLPEAGEKFDTSGGAEPWEIKERKKPWEE